MRFGIIPAVISPYVLQAIGPRQAQRYFQSGERFDAARAGPWVWSARWWPGRPAGRAGGGAGRVAARAARARNAPARELIAAVHGRPLGEATDEDTAQRIARQRAYRRSARKASPPFWKTPGRLAALSLPDSAVHHNNHWRKTPMTLNRTPLASPSGLSTAAGRRHPVRRHRRNPESVSARGAADSALNIGQTTRVTSNSSLIGFQGAEDLGNGLKAIWQVESGLAIDTGGGNFGTRDTFIGLTSPSMGTLQLGY